jgi:hypothetical protein
MAAENRMIDRIARAAMVAAMTAVAACAGGQGNGDAAAKAGGAPPPPAAQPPLLPPAMSGSPAPMQLTPLTDDDIKLYLDVMEAAAERIMHPTPDDQKVTAQANKAMMGAKPGQTLAPEDGRAMVRFTTMMTNMDLIVAEERRVDVRRYEGIRGIVEDVVPNPATATMMAIGKSRDVPAAPPPDPRVKSAEAGATKPLAPYKARIQRALSIVRKSGSLPR